jgi:hypothetical protein
VAQLESRLREAEARFAAHERDKKLAEQRAQEHAEQAAAERAARERLEAERAARRTPATLPVVRLAGPGGASWIRVGCLP